MKYLLHIIFLLSIQSVNCQDNIEFSLKYCDTIMTYIGCEVDHNYAVSCNDCRVSFYTFRADSSYVFKDCFEEQILTSRQNKLKKNYCYQLVEASSFGGELCGYMKTIKKKKNWYYEFSLRGNVCSDMLGLEISFKTLPNIKMEWPATAETFVQKIKIKETIFKGKHFEE